MDGGYKLTLLPKHSLYGGRAAEIGSALAAVLTFCPRPYNRFCGQPIA